MRFSIIIPALNEAQSIQTVLRRLQAFRAEAEIILVDGGSIDNTALLAQPYVDRVLDSAKGRALQMNAGARMAQGEILIFLHADTVLPDDALPLIRVALSGDRQWGRFDISFDGQHLMFKVIAQLMNWRSALTGIATGDQALFVTKRAFYQVNQYPEIDLMEDIALTKVLKKISAPARLTAKVTSSSRRWQARGICQTIILMWWLRLLYFFGVDTKFLADCYREGRLWKL
jgi:rSAM/selenodomain-associated transferase 2